MPCTLVLLFHPAICDYYSVAWLLDVIYLVHTASGTVLARKGVKGSTAYGAATQSSSRSSSIPDEFAVDLSKLTLEQLERLREKAREKQWEDEWWSQYMKYENTKKAALEKEYKQKEKQTIAQFNITLTRWVCSAAGARQHFGMQDRGLSPRASQCQTSPCRYCKHTQEQEQEQAAAGSQHLVAVTCRHPCACGTAVVS